MTTLTAAKASLLKGLHMGAKTRLASDNILRFIYIYFFPYNVEFRNILHNQQKCCSPVEWPFWDPCI